MKDKTKLIASSAAYILGMKPKVEIKGTPSQIKNFKEVLDASRNLYAVLQEGSNFSVESALERKKTAAQKFGKEFGWSWPL